MEDINMTWKNFFKKKKETKIKMELIGEIPKDIDSKEFRKSLETITDDFTPFIKSFKVALEKDDLTDKQKFALGMSLGAMIITTHKKIMEKYVDVPLDVPEELKSYQEFGKNPPSYVG